MNAKERKYFDSDEQRGCFAKYFEDLAMPKDRHCDCVFLELCNIRCDKAERVSTCRLMNAYYSVTRMLKMQWTK